MKKILLFLFLYLSILSYTYAGSYNFGHFPGDVNSNNVKEIGAGGYKILYYQGEGNISEFERPDFKAVESFGKAIGYIKSMKISNHWKNTFKDIQDDNIDLSYLDSTKHKYPIIGFFVGNKLTLFVEESLIKDSDQETIGYLYESDEIRIMKVGNWYTTELNVGSFDGIIYNFSTYWNLFKKNYYKGQVVNFQIGGNPINKYDINYFNNNDTNILQLDVIVKNKLKGLVISLNKNYVISTNYDKDYYQDEYLMEEVNSMYTAVISYYKYMFEIPTSINSMAFMGFYDTSILSKYGQEIKYTKKNILCYQVGFKPNSSTFKKLNKLNSEGFYMNEFCIK